MLAIPGSIQTLLKSKIQAGVHKPTGVVEFTGMPSSQSMLDPHIWTVWREFSSPAKLNGNMCETIDGRAVMCYCESNTIKIAFSPLVKNILNGTANFDFANEVTVATKGDIAISARINLVDEKLCMTIKYHTADPDHCVVEFWRDQDGKGNGFEYVSTICPEYRPNIYYGDHPNGAHTYVNKVGTNKLAVVMGWWVITEEATAFYSDDNGATWTQGSSPWYPTAASESMIFLGDGEFMLAITENATGAYLQYYNNSASYTQIPWEGWDLGWPEHAPWYPSFIVVEDKLYMAMYHGVAGHLLLTEFLPEVPTPQNIPLRESWSAVWEIPCDGLPSCENGLIAGREALILQHVNASTKTISGAGTELLSKTIPIKSITIDRSKGSASQATVIIDNKEGMYSPDPIGPWHEIIWPNTVTRIKLGYGADQQQVFEGYLDELTMSSYPGSITFVARDLSKKALDQMVQWTSGNMTYYGISYLEQTPEYIFRDLAIKAGWADANIHTEVSGISIKEIKFVQEMYADAFQRLIELCGFEWFCDEIGDLYFRKAVEPDPSAAYVFTEGVDIFSLDYTISDRELYSRVIVVSQTEANEDGESSTVWASVDWSAATYYKLPTQKVLYIQATDLASTTEQCLELANRACAAINPKPRQVTFVAVGNPYLQIGDCIQVIESTSTISEIYRIFALTHNMEAEGSPIFATTIQCYHYAAA